MENLPLSNLPLNSTPQDSASSAKKFFNSYYDKSVSVPTDALDATVDFFRKRGFEETAAVMVSTVLLAQAKIEKTPIFKILDTLQGLDEVQFSTIVREILNYKRLRISTLATKVDNSNSFEYEKRNIIV